MATPADGPRSSDRRAAAWLAALAALAYLPFSHCHFSASDETGVYDPAVALWERGTLAVEPGKHIFRGRDGRHYSHFAVGQTLLAVPFVALGDAATRVIGAERLRRAIGRESDGAIDTLETPGIFLVGAYAPLVTGALLGVFFAFERALGASRRGALWATALLGACTYVATHSVYFLRHTSEALAILAALAALHAWRRSGSLAWLAAGSAATASIALIRVPAAVAVPALAAYLLFTLRGRLGGPPRRTAALAAAVALPAVAAAALHLGVNHAKWGTWIGSPMLAQSFLLNGSLLDGLGGLLLSPGASLFAYSPLLLLAPLTLPGLWRAHRAECATLLAVCAGLLWLAASFVFWHGLWSAPGPRYLLALTPLLMLPLGPWLDRARATWQRALVAGLATLGLAIQLVLMLGHWRRTVLLMGYQAEAPHMEFLSDPLRSPIVGHLRAVLAGEVDVWLWTLVGGVPGREPLPGLAVVLLALWAGASAACALRLRAALARAD